MSSLFTRKTLLQSGAIAGFSFLLGQVGKDHPLPAIAAQADHPNVAIIKRYYEAYSRGDLATVRSIFASDITWKIPGHHPLAGTKRGADEVFAFFEQLTKADFRAEVLFLGGNEKRISNTSVASFWIEGNTGQCVEIVTSEGRYRDISYVDWHHCKD
ncbi:MAG: nuclear transport factor 2 family protein [Synechococcales cyanobacterium C42_A2020_086]|jgi:hypothetical protein|nr:nuclear transport factor 2 family protein [Synechococcales cyanobacterium C42_A2020_086]